MSQTFVLSTLTQGLIIVLLLSAPAMFSAMIIGLMVSILQTVTSIQEQTLSFVPKALVVFAVLIGTAPWMMNMTTQYMTELYGRIPMLVK